MPWTPDDAPKHQARARTPHLRRLWAQTADKARAELIEAGRSEEYADRHAIRIASAAVDKAIDG